MESEGGVASWLAVQSNWVKSEGGAVAWLAMQHTVALRMDGQKSQVVSKVMVVIIKEANFVEKKSVRKRMTLQLFKTTIESCCEEDSSLLVLERRPFHLTVFLCKVPGWEVEVELLPSWLCRGSGWKWMGCRLVGCAESLNGKGRRSCLLDSCAKSLDGKERRSFRLVGCASSWMGSGRRSSAWLALQRS